MPTTKIVGAHGLVDALWTDFACRPHRGVRFLGERCAGAGDRPSSSGHLRCGVLRVAWRWLSPTGDDAGPLPRTYLVAGVQEPFFHENATRWAQALGDAGADVVLAERFGSHGGAFWREELLRMVAWAFGE